MELKELLSVINSTSVSNMRDDIRLTGIEYDSKEIENGHLFFSIKGENHDGNLFIKEALDKGACGVVVSDQFYNDALENKNNDYKKILDELNGREIPVVVVRDVVSAVSKASAFYYTYPSRELSLIGITGTNGKTSASFMMESVLKHAGFKPGIIGTVLYRYNGQEIRDIEYTTPKSLYLQRLTRKMLGSGVSHLLMEVSSHGLEMGRVNDLDFELCIFTNLSRDHMDYHKTMDNYFNAKKKLFTELLPKSSKKHKVAVINVDCEYGRKLVGYVRLLSGVSLYTYGTSEEADFRITEHKLDETGSKFAVLFDGSKMGFEIPLIGMHNVLNATACIASAIKLYEIPYDTLKSALKEDISIPGRLERVTRGFNVFVDYAHTDDALSNVLISLRNSFPGKRIVTVFGCGGDRDKGKRPKMGKAVSDYSDYAIVTSDNPRFEDPVRIIDSIVAGMRPNSYEIIVSREDAIRKAIQIMDKDNDVILIAGKGHERYQTIKGSTRDFDDKKLAKIFLQQ